MKPTSTAHSKVKSAPPATATPPEATPDTKSKDEFVRQAAYSYYEARGRIGGHELDDWLQAEAEFERLNRP